MSEPVGVILAAGLASRMGRPKQLLPFGESSVLGSVVAAARRSELDRLVVVVGAYAAAVEADPSLEGVEVVHNPEPERGNLSSLMVAATTTGTSPVLLLMGDMPGVTAAVIDAHLEAWRRSTAWLRITQYTDGAGHPMLLSPDVVENLAGLEGPKPLWELTQDARCQSLQVDTPMPIDVDTPDDYAAALAKDLVDP